jgi:hypothetical protein
MTLFDINQALAKAGSENATSPILLYPQRPDTFRILFFAIA